MVEIELNRVCPNVFEDIDIKSEVWNTSLRIDPGGRYQVMAQSGKGKTSFLYFLLGLRSDYKGDIYLNQKKILEINEQEWVLLRKRKMSSIFQDLQLINHLSVAENIGLVPEYANGYNEASIRDMLRAVGIADKWNEKVKTLSFGQKQRVAIIRSLCKPFKLLLCDEPFSHLDEANTKLCRSLIIKRLDEEQAGIIITSLDGEKGMGLKTINL
jgi:ABC-type lipoprotein export system ATPase subunit